MSNWQMHGRAKCPHCQSEVSVRPFRRLRDVSCPACHRLVFREERIWGKLWIVVCVLLALAAGIIIYRKTENVMQAWAVYVNYLIPAAIVLVLAPLGNLLMYLVHRVKETK